MTPLSQRLLALYLSALIILAALGAHNQRRITYQNELLERQGTLNTRLTALRAESASITGALSVQRWALAQGMVAAPKALNISEINPSKAPRLVNPNRLPTRVEVQTLWH